MSLWAGAEAGDAVGEDPEDPQDGGVGLGMGAGLCGHSVSMALRCLALKAVLKSCKSQGRFYRANTNFPFFGL